MPGDLPTAFLSHHLTRHIHSQTMPAKNIVVVGGGIVGTLTAYYLATSKHRGEDVNVTIVEATEIAAAASGNAGGLLALDWHGGATASVSALSYELHAKLAEEFGGESWGYRKIDTLSVTHDASGEKQGKKSPLHWLPKERVLVTRSLGTPSTTAQVHPRLFTKKMSTLFLEQPRTSILIAKATSLSISPTTATPETLTVQPTDGSPAQTLPCDTLVLAAGPWNGTLAKELLPVDVAERVRIDGSRAHSIVLRTRQPLTPHALFMDMTMADGRPAEPEVYCRPDGTAVICGGTDDVPLPDLASEVHPAPKQIAELHTQSHSVSPVFTPQEGVETVAELACYLPISGTGNPVLGKVPGIEGVFVGGGNSCWGITQGPGMGKCLSELILEGKVSSANVSRLTF